MRALEGYSHCGVHQKRRRAAAPHASSIYGAWGRLTDRKGSIGAGLQSATLDPARLQRFRAAALEQRARDTRRRLWSVGRLVTALVVFDIYGLSLGSGSARYALVALPVIVLGMARSRLNPLTIRGPGPADVYLLALFLFGTAGSLWAIMFGTTRSPALALFLPMSLALLHLTTLGTMDEDEAKVNLRWLSFLMSAYVAVHAASALGLLELINAGGANPAASVAGAVFGHEKAFLLCTALAAASLMRRWRLVILLLVLWLVAFVAYPAASYLVAAVVTLMTVLATGHRSTRTRAYGLGVLCIAFLALVVAEVTTSGPGTASSLSSSYFDAVGKSDNNETRAELWSEAWDKMWASPVFGSAFAGDTAIEVPLDGKRREVPPHNDFLQMGMGGGLLGMGLLSGWVLMTNAVALGRVRRIRSSGLTNTAMLVRVLLVGYNSFFAVALLNPVMSRVGLSIVVMLFYAMMMTIDEPSQSGRLGRATVDESVA